MHRRDHATLAAAVELPSITIITPCLDAAATIQEAIDSVRGQDHPGVEHLVLDAGSTDGTLEVLERSGVRYVSEPDDGRPDALNKGLALATGEIIGWLNADDRYEPGALRAVAEAFAARPDAQWVTGYCRIIDGEGDEIRRAVTAYKNALLRHWSLGLYLTQNFVSDPATFARRRALEAIGPVNGRWRISHDYDVWLRMARLGEPVVLRRTLSSFRMAEGSLSMAGFERQFREHEEIARLHGQGHPVAVAVNAAMSRLIVLAYRLMRQLRTARAHA
jgi:glycosyltransferase involved in cell wall biosynthesis